MGSGGAGLGGQPETPRGQLAIPGPLGLDQPHRRLSCLLQCPLQLFPGLVQQPAPLTLARAGIRLSVRRWKQPDHHRVGWAHC